MRHEAYGLVRFYWQELLVAPFFLTRNCANLCRYTPFLLRWPVRIAVLAVFFAYLAVSIAGTFFRFWQKSTNTSLFY